MAPFHVAAKRALTPGKQIFCIFTASKKLVFTKPSSGKLNILVVHAWSGANIRLRGKITLLTESMEEEPQHWIALSQRQSGGVEKEAVCRVEFALMTSDPEHYRLVQAQHPEYQI